MISTFRLSSAKGADGRRHPREQFPVRSGSAPDSAHEDPWRQAIAKTVAGLTLAAVLASVSLKAQSPPAATDQASSPDTTIRVDVDLVNVFFTVHTKKGAQLIPNLTKDDFTIFEDGKQQTIKRFSREADQPLTLGLLIDISASQGNLIEIERQAAAQFFSSVIRPKDEAFLISFGKSTDLLQDYTNSARLLTEGLKDLRGDGQPPMMRGSPVPVNTGPIGGSLGTPKGTLLFDAIYLASDEKLKSEVGRKALILITDGDDQGSSYKLQDAISAAQHSDAVVYSIYYVDRQFYGGMGGGGEGDLRRISEETGGHVFKVDSKHTLNDIFRQIQDELRNQYSISYTPGSPRDGSFRHVEIKTDNPDYRVQARSGYYATKNDAQ